MPRSLLGRTLLIMLVPLVVVQAVALQMFYGSHSIWCRAGCPAPSPGKSPTPSS